MLPFLLICFVLHPPPPPPPVRVSQVDSIGETSVLIHFLGGPKRFLLVVYSALLIMGVLVAKALGYA